jgi:hypothetical protein
MKRLFAITFAALVLLSLFAWRMQPAPDGKLIWVSDDNPARHRQISLFNSEAAAGIAHSKGVRLDRSNSGMEMEKRLGCWMTSRAHERSHG